MARTVSGTGLVFVLGLAAFAILLGLGIQGYLPFAFESAEITSFVLFIFVVAMAFEVFKEEKIRSIKDLTNKPFAMVETVFMVVTIAVAVVLATFETVPTSIEPLVGWICIIAGVVMVIELKH